MLYLTPSSERATESLDYPLNFGGRRETVAPTTRAFLMSISNVVLFVATYAALKLVLG